MGLQDLLHKLTFHFYMQAETLTVSEQPRLRTPEVRRKVGVVLCTVNIIGVEFRTFHEAVLSNKSRTVFYTYKWSSWTLIL